MDYSDKNVKEIERHYNDLERKYNEIILKLTALQSTFKEKKSIEYLYQGVMRRLKVMRKCILNIFSLFPLKIAVKSP